MPPIEERRTLLGPASNRSGVAIFMVLATLSVLTFLVAEFVYVSQVNQKLAYDHFDQLRAHQLAKSALKLSILRLKAFQIIKATLNNLGPAAQAIPKGMLNQVWSFPLAFPIRTDLPGLSPSDREGIAEFHKSSGLDGSFLAVIESESQRFNLNTLVESDKTPLATPSPGASPSPSPSPSPSQNPRDPAAARQSLQDYLVALLNRKLETDEVFARQYRDYRLTDLVQNIAAWIDPQFESPTYRRDHPIPPRRAVMDDLSELHMIPGMEEPIYNLFAPHLTVAPTGGFNVNVIQEGALRALFPLMNDDEVRDFFRFRDAPPPEDNTFSDVNGFWEWMKNNLSSIRGDAREVQRLQENLTARGIELGTEDMIYRITVSATVQTATRGLQAFVKILPANNPAAAQPPGGGVTLPPSGAAAPIPGTTAAPLPKATGIQIETLRIL